MAINTVVKLLLEAGLVPTWRVGDRSSATRVGFMDDFRKRLRNRVPLTSDGHKPYLIAVEEERLAGTWTTPCW